MIRDLVKLATLMFISACLTYQLGYGVLPFIFGAVYVIAVYMTHSYGYISGVACKSGIFFGSLAIIIAATRLSLANESTAAYSTVIELACAFLLVALALLAIIVFRNLEAWKGEHIGLHPEDMSEIGPRAYPFSK